MGGAQKRKASESIGTGKQRRTETFYGNMIGRPQLQGPHTLAHVFESDLLQHGKMSTSDGLQGLLDAVCPAGEDGAAPAYMDPDKLFAPGTSDTKPELIKHSLDFHADRRAEAQAALNSPGAELAEQKAAVFAALNCAPGATYLKKGHPHHKFPARASTLKGKGERSGMAFEDVIDEGWMSAPNHPAVAGHLGRMSTFLDANGIGDGKSNKALTDMMAANAMTLPS